MKNDFVERRVRRIPQRHGVELRVTFGNDAVAVQGHFVWWRAGWDDFDGDSQISAVSSAENFEMHAALVDVSGYPEMIDVRRRTRLEKNRLPDPAGRRVPTPLFADGLFVVV